MTLIAADKVDEVLGATLARRFAGNARRMAHAARLVIVHGRQLRPRTMLYEPPAAPGGNGVVALPMTASGPVEEAMIALAVGLHLDGTSRSVAYADGVLVGPTKSRHRAAVRFARGFLGTSRSAESIEVTPRDRRAS